MKRIFFILLILLSFNGNLYAQIEDSLDELVIERMSKKSINEIILEIRKKLYNNYADGHYHYLVENQAMIQIDDCTDSLFNIRLLYNVNLDLRNKKINKSVVDDKDNKEELNPNYFSLYPGHNDSPLYWLSEFVLRKYVNIAELDFFINVPDYHYDRSRDGKNTRVDFSAIGMYYGYFTFDNNYNLVEIEFELDQPYPVNHAQSKNGKFMFKKSWVYQSELLRIKMGLNNKKEMYIQSLEAKEKIVDYNFLRHNNQGEVMVDDQDLNFLTTLKFTKQ